MTRPTLHLVYPHGPRISCPDAIGRNLARRLGDAYTVVTHDWDARVDLHLQPGDCLVGHPHPDARTIFRRNARQLGWRRVLMLCPYAHGDLRQVALWDTVIPRCDLYLAITGRYWMRTLPQSSFSHWQPKMVHVDLAVDRTDFPVLKRAFAPPGRRRFLYIGSTAWMKNPGYLEAIAQRVPGMAFSWIGSGRRGLAGFRPYGQMDFSQAASRALVAEHDFILTAGFSDANPTVLLEGMAWGLIPVCTPQSGYEGYRSMVNIPLANANAAADILQGLQHAPDADLRAWQEENFQLLDQHFHWDRVAAQVRAALESEARPPLLPESIGRTLRLRWAAWTSPYAPWHPRVLARRLAARVRRK